jgi:hypothetical protein
MTFTERMSEVCNLIAIATHCGIVCVFERDKEKSCAINCFYNIFSAQTLIREMHILTI